MALPWSQEEISRYPVTQRDLYEAEKFYYSRGRDPNIYDPINIHAAFQKLITDRGRREFEARQTARYEYKQTYAKAAETSKAEGFKSPGAALLVKERLGVPVTQEQLLMSKYGLTPAELASGVSSPMFAIKQKYGLSNQEINSLVSSSKAKQIEFMQARSIPQTPQALKQIEEAKNFAKFETEKKAAVVSQLARKYGITLEEFNKSMSIPNSKAPYIQEFFAKQKAFIKFGESADKGKVVPEAYSKAEDVYTYGTARIAEPFSNSVKTMYRDLLNALYSAPIDIARGVTNILPKTGLDIVLTPRREFIAEVFAAPFQKLDVLGKEYQAFGNLMRQQAYKIIPKEVRFTPEQAIGTTVGLGVAFLEYATPFLWQLMVAVGFAKTLNEYQEINKVKTSLKVVQKIPAKDYKKYEDGEAERYNKQVDEYNKQVDKAVLLTELALAVNAIAFVIPPILKFIKYEKQTFRVPVGVRTKEGISKGLTPAQAIQEEFFAVAIPTPKGAGYALVTKKTIVPEYVGVEMTRLEIQSAKLRNLIDFAGLGAKEGIGKNRLITLARQKEFATSILVQSNTLKEEALSQSLSFSKGVTSKIIGREQLSQIERSFSALTKSQKVVLTDPEFIKQITSTQKRLIVELTTDKFGNIGVFKGLKEQEELFMSKVNVIQGQRVKDVQNLLAYRSPKKLVFTSLAGQKPQKVISMAKLIPQLEDEMLKLYRVETATLKKAATPRISIKEVPVKEAVIQRGKSFRENIIALGRNVKNEIIRDYNLLRKDVSETYIPKGRKLQAVQTAKGKLIVIKPQEIPEGAGKDVLNNVEEQVKKQIQAQKQEQELIKKALAQAAVPAKIPKTARLPRSSEQIIKEQAEKFEGQINSMLKRGAAKSSVQKLPQRKSIEKEYEQQMKGYSSMNRDLEKQTGQLQGVSIQAGEAILHPKEIQNRIIKNNEDISFSVQSRELQLQKPQQPAPQKQRAPFKPVPSVFSLPPTPTPPSESFIRLKFKPSPIAKEERIGKRKGIAPGYFVFIKQVSTNNFVRLNNYPLTESRALDVGSYYVDQTVARTFKLQKAKQPAQLDVEFTSIPIGYYATIHKKIRAYKIKKGTPYSFGQQFIERGTGVLDTAAERRQLQAFRNQIKNFSRL